MRASMLRIFILSVSLLAYSLTAKSQTVYKTPSGSHYHLLECRMVNNVSTELTLSEAIAEGLAPCRICKPPSGNSSIEALGKHGVGISETVQCKGLTKAGTRCKHMTRMANGYCFQHNPDKAK